MYTMDGDFGKVRLFTNVPLKNMEYLFCYTSVGWHRCNDKYLTNRLESGSIDSTLILTVSGSGILEVYGKTFLLSAGDMFVLPPNTPHAYYPEKGRIWEFYWLHILDNHATNFINKIVENNEPVFKYREPDKLIALYEKLIAYKDHFFDDCSVEESKLLSDLMHDLLTYKTKNIYENERVKDLLERALRFIAMHYQEDINTKDICAELFISQTHLIRLFNKHLEITPYQYLEQYRIAKASVLLAHTPLSIADVAASVGYQSSSNFISKFKKYKKLTPQQYRKTKAYNQQ